MIAYGTEPQQSPVQDIQILRNYYRFTGPPVDWITNNAYTVATKLSPDKGEENTKLTTNSKKRKKITAKPKPIETISENKRKKKKTQLDKVQKHDLKAWSQKKCKHVQFCFEKYGHGYMTTYGRHRFEENMCCHRLNCRSAGQNEDEFDNKLKGQMQQVTLIIPFTKLDVIVETKTENNIFLVKKTKMVHC